MLIRLGRLRSYPSLLRSTSSIPLASQRCSNPPLSSTHRSLLFWIVAKSACTLALQVPNFFCKVFRGRSKHRVNTGETFSRVCGRTEDEGLIKSVSAWGWVADGESVARGEDCTGRLPRRVLRTFPAKGVPFLYNMYLPPVM